MTKKAIVWVFVVLICGFAADRAAAQTVASLDFCADQYVLALADVDEIVGVSPHAETEFSYYAEKAVGLPEIRPTAEEILILAPDLVVRQWGGGYGAGTLLERFGVPVVQVSFAVTMAETRANLLRVGEAMGKLDRATKIADEMDERLAAVLAREAVEPHEQAPAALYITPSGTTSGRGTFVHEVMTAAGVTNVSADLGNSPWHPINLEALALSPPDMIVAGFFDLRSRRVDNWSLSRHHFLRNQLETLPVSYVPSADLACAAWFVVDAIEKIAHLRTRLEDAPRSLARD
jgi:iron complex transport system substrate-binding protein